MWYVSPLSAKRDIPSDYFVAARGWKGMFYCMYKIICPVFFVFFYNLSIETLVCCIDSRYDHVLHNQLNCKT